MKKLLIALTLILMSVPSYGAVIPLMNIGNCTDLAQKTSYPTTCSMFLFSNSNVLVEQGDTFNISCTFSAGKNTGGLILGNVFAFVDSPIVITSGPAIPADQKTSLITGGNSSIKYSWTGVTNARMAGTFFGISFLPPENLQNNQTIKVNCVNNG